MIFGQSNVPQPIQLPFNWVADYFDGSSLTEYDLKSHRPNSFYSVNQNETIRFGLIGNNSKFYFDMIDGHFHLKGKRLDIVYVDNDGVEYHLTDNDKKKDLITFKSAFTDFDRNKIVQNSNLESINFGYKTLYKKKDLELFFQPIVSFPFGASAFIEIKMTSNKNLDGDLVFYVRGKERERFYAPLEKGISGQMNWTIK